MTSDVFDYLCGEAADDGAGRDVFIDHRTGRDDCALADGDALKDSDVSSDPYLIADFHRGGHHIGASVRVHYVVEGGYHAVMADEHVIANGDSALVLKFAAGIDEHPFADADVLAAVSIKRREKPETLMDFTAGQLRHQGDDFGMVMIGVVNLHGDSDSLLTELVHLGMDGTSAGDNLPGVHYFNEFFSCHFRYSVKKAAISSKGIMSIWS